MTGRLGIDFGTSNTAVALADGARARLIPLGGGAVSIPTAIFLDYDAREMLFGADAVAALIAGRHGRFMRALKRVLGTSLMREPRQLLNRRTTLLEVVAEFLASIRMQAEAATGQRFRRVLSGRPVRFHAADPDRDLRAEADLAECYRLAGFTEIDFMHEPEAAALTDAGAGEGLGLVVDIGGGTSDFTVFRQRGGRIEVVASHGERIGGTDFDKALSLAHVMPLLGLGTRLRAAFGPDLHVAPVGLFHDLATWEKIAFLYSADTRRAAGEMAKVAEEPAKFARLVEVLEMELGHDIAFAVEAAKIAANTGTGEINLDVVESGLRLGITRDDLAADLAPFARQIGAGATTTLALAGVRPEQIDRVVFVGGSSLLHSVQAAMLRQFPQARMVQAEAFAAVAKGLALAARAQDRG